MQALPDPGNFKNVKSNLYVLVVFSKAEAQSLLLLNDLAINKEDSDRATATLFLPNIRAGVWLTLEARPIGTKLIR